MVRVKCKATMLARAAWPTALKLLDTVLMRAVVAMTRPRRHLCVIGDSDTISQYVRLHPSHYRLIGRLCRGRPWPPWPFLLEMDSRKHRNGIY